MSTDIAETLDARWNTWKAKGAAADRIARRRMQIVYAALVIALVCVTVVFVL